MIKNPIVVSLGEPSGIGPEVFLKAIFETSLKEQLELITVVASKKVIKNVSQELNYHKINSLKILSRQSLYPILESYFAVISETDGYCQFGDKFIIIDEFFRYYNFIQLTSIVRYKKVFAIISKL